MESDVDNHDPDKPKVNDQGNGEDDQGSVTSFFQQVRKGDEKAVVALWDRLFPKLHEIARKRAAGMAATPEQVDAEQVALNAFHSMVQAVHAGQWQGVSGRRELWAMLRTLVLRKTIREIETNRRFLRQSPELDEETTAWHWEKNFREEVEDLLSRFQSPISRQVLICQLQGLTQEEIAETLGVSPRTIRRKLALIRSALKQALKEDR